MARAAFQTAGPNEAACRRTNVCFSVVHPPTSTGSSGSSAASPFPDWPGGKLSLALECLGAAEHVCPDPARVAVRDCQLSGQLSLACCATVKSELFPFHF